MQGADPGTATRVSGGGLVLSVDAMGGDRGPSAVVEGIGRFLGARPAARVLLHGPEAELGPLLAGLPWAGQVTIRHASGVVSMQDKPGQVMRRGRDTSMWSAVESVREGEAQVCISCGNTGALMAVSMLVLRKAAGVNRPAIACLWPSLNPGGYNLMLDAGADIRADEDDLLTYALMGVAYARIGLGVACPRVGLLNVGTEEHKGRSELKAAHDLIARAAEHDGFGYTGFIEGGDIPSSKIDVVVTDGFTGNVALKTAEGTSHLIAHLLREALMGSFWGKLSALMGRGVLKRLRARIDPRSVNGGVFLGLNGTVIKSHGGSDATAIATALDLAWRLAEAGFTQTMAGQVAQAVATRAEADAATGEPKAAGEA
ncbi:MAG: phosphate acyltransferase PlsX [Rubellimicrobium sp.]|nr:phosphate acyltransferase PlsX [Rubellimicrobium sp.]